MKWLLLDPRGFNYLIMALSSEWTTIEEVE